MDTERFDGLIRALGHEVTRRSTLSFDAPLNMPETGATIPLLSPVWTNTGPKDEQFSLTLECGNWQSAAVNRSGFVGSTSSTAVHWTAQGGNVCSSDEMRLYCF